MRDAFSDVGEAAAIRYAVDAGARVINLSLGGSRTSTVEQFVVINDFAELDTALVAIFYLVRT